MRGSCNNYPLPCVNITLAVVKDPTHMHCDDPPCAKAANAITPGAINKRVEGKSPAGSGRKCHFYLHRLNAGMLPACVTTCPVCLVCLVCHGA